MRVSKPHPQRKVAYLLTCEHASHRIPRGFEYLFVGAKSVLKTHRGWDPGALELAEWLAKAFDWPLIRTDFTRLLVEPNRSERPSQIFSEFSKPLNQETKNTLLETLYWPHRLAIADWIRCQPKRLDHIVHLGIHTFTPVLNGVKRNADIGMLYDPQRAAERRFCSHWQDAYRAEGIAAVRLNYPYRGTSDGLTRLFRQEFGPRYLGIELEVSQRFPLGSSSAWKAVLRQSERALETVLQCDWWSNC